MVVAVLKDHPDGLVALDILKNINERFDKEYVRTSLSPQLTRLMNNGKVHKKGKTWLIGPSQFHGLFRGIS